MRIGLLAWFAAFAVTCTPSAALADEAKAPDESADRDIEHTLIVGVGGAVELELGDGSLHPGGNIMVEWEAVENLLEFELGVSLLGPGGGGHSGNEGVQVPVDLLVKKPFRLARNLEFMIGAGPEVVWVTGVQRGAYFGGEFALDLMFWPMQHVGVWIEPEYDFVFHDGVSHGLGSTGGLLLGW